MRFRPLDLTVPADVRAWADLRASVYLGARPDERELAGLVADVSPGRVTVVDDDGYLAGAFRSFDTELSVPGGALIPANAISGVLVRSTHQRRGLLTGWLRPELERAATAGAVVSVLFASEATIYGRYGFAPVTADASWSLDVTRARFTGTDPGTLRYVDLAEIEAIGARLYPAAQSRAAGSITRNPATWRRLRGKKPDGVPERTWAVVHQDETGQIDGQVVYRIDGDGMDRTPPTLVVLDLLAANRTAERSLWRHCAGLDFIGRLECSVAGSDCPLPWWLTDPRAAAVSDVQDGLWLRIHDVERFLAARRYPVPGRFRLRVEDPQEQVTGTYEVAADDSGRGTCQRLPDGTPPDVTLTPAALATLTFGVPAGTPSLSGMQDDGSLTPAGDGDFFRLAAFFSTPWPRWSLTRF